MCQKGHRAIKSIFSSFRSDKLKGLLVWLPMKEKDDAAKFGNERLLKDFLPVVDNLERALDHVEQHDPGQVIEGVRLVQKLFETMLAMHLGSASIPSFASSAIELGWRMCIT